MVAEYNVQPLLTDAETITKLILHDAFRRGISKTQIDGQLQRLDQLKKSIKNIKSQVAADYDYLSKDERKIKEFSLGRAEIDKYIPTLDIFRPSINFDDSELDGIKTQVSSILKLSIHNANLERKLAELSEAVQLDRKQAVFIDELVNAVASHSQQVGALKAKDEEIGKIQEELIQIQDGYIAKFDRLRKDLRKVNNINSELLLASVERETEFKGIVQQLNQEHKTKLNSILEEHKAKIASLQAIHKQKLNELDQQNLQSDIDLMRENRKLLTEQSTKHAAKIAELNRLHEAKIQELNREHEAQINSLKQQLRENDLKVVEDKQRGIEALKTTLEEQKQTIVAELSAANNEKAGLTDRLTLFESFISKIAVALDIKEYKNEADLPQLAEKIAAVSQSDAEKTRTIAELTNKLKTSTDLIQQNLQQFEVEKAKLVKQNTVLLEKNKQLEAQLEQSGKDNKELQKQLTEAKKQLFNIEGDNRKLTKANETITARNVSLEKEVAGLREQIGAYIILVADASKSKTEAHDLIKASLTSLTEPLSNLSEDEKNQVKKLIDKLDINTVITYFPVILKSIIDIYKTRRISNKVETIAESKTIDPEVLEKLQQELAKTKEEYDKLKQTVLNLKGEYDKDLQDKVAQMLDMYENYRNEVSVKEAKYLETIENLRTELNKTPQDVQALAALKQRLDAQSTEIQGLKDKNLSLLNEIDQLKLNRSGSEELKRLRDLINTQYQQIQTLQKANSDLMALNTNLQNDFDAATETNLSFAALQEQNKALEDQKRVWEEQKATYEAEQNKAEAIIKGLNEEIRSLKPFKTEYNENIQKMIEYMNQVIISYRSKIETFITDLMTQITDDARFDQVQKERLYDMISYISKDNGFEFGYQINKIDLPPNLREMYNGEPRTADEFKITYFSHPPKDKPDKFEIRSLTEDGKFVYEQAENGIKGGAQAKNKVSQQELHKLNQLVKYVKKEIKMPNIAAKCGELERLIKKATVSKLDPKNKAQLLQVYKDLKLELVLLELAASKHPHELIKDLYRQKKITSQQMEKFEKVLTKKVGGAPPVESTAGFSAVDVIVIIIILLALITIYLWFWYHDNEKMGDDYCDEEAVSCCN